MFLGKGHAAHAHRERRGAQGAAIVEVRHEAVMEDDRHWSHAAAAPIIHQVRPSNRVCWLEMDAAACSEYTQEATATTHEKAELHGVLRETGHLLGCPDCLVINKKSYIPGLTIQPAHLAVIQSQECTHPEKLLDTKYLRIVSGQNDTKMMTLYESQMNPTQLRRPTRPATDGSSRLLFRSRRSVAPAMKQIRVPKPEAT